MTTRPETARVAFTKRILERIEPPKNGRVHLYDTKAAGLALQITATGSKVFYLYRRVGGRPVRHRLGAFPDMTVENARKAVTRKAAEILEGRDPQAEKRADREAPTLGEAFTRFIDEHAKLHKRTWQEDVKYRDRYLKGWLTRKLASITTDNVRALHARIGEKNGKYAANRLLALLSKVFNHAAAFGMFKGVNPCRGVRKFAERQRERFLQPDELPRFFAALDAEPNTTIRDFFRLLIFAGARRENTMAMRWDELNLDAGTWRIPITKSGDAQTVYLSAEAVKVLRDRRTAANGSAWVFPSYGRTGHLAEPKQAWKRILARAKIADLRLHDLRRTLASWQATTGASLTIIGKTLGHKSQAATAIYARVNMDPVKQSVDAATAAMMAAATPTKEGGRDDG